MISSCDPHREAVQVEELQRPIRWDDVAAWSRRHRVEPLVLRRLGAGDLAVPAWLYSQLGERVASIAQSNLRAAAEAGRIHDRFTRAGLRLLFVKGLTLSALAYGDPFLKMSSDIDVLIDPGELGAAMSLLAELGYAPIVPAGRDIADWHGRRKESVWQETRSGLILDLHTRLVDNPALLPGLGLNSPTLAVEIAPGLSLPTLDPKLLFAYLCVHGASSAWFRLKWLADLVAYAARFDTVSMTDFYRKALQAGAGRAPAQALLLTDQLFAARLDPGLRDQIASDAMVRLLAKIALNQLIRLEEPTDRPLGTMPIHAAQLLMQPGARFKIAELARQLGNILR